jgi:hypothetical protein
LFDCRFDYFRIRSSSIEFLRFDRLQKVYFQRPHLPLSQAVRTQLLMEVDRSSAEEKTRDFLLRFDPALKKVFVINAVWFLILWLTRKHCAFSAACLSSWSPRVDMNLRVPRRS